MGVAVHPEVQKSYGCVIHPVYTIGESAYIQTVRLPNKKYHHPKYLIQREAGSREGRIWLLLSADIPTPHTRGKAQGDYYGTEGSWVLIQEG